MADGGRDELDRLLRRAAGFAESHDDERWQVVAELHGRTDRLAFDAACRLARAERSSDRVLGLDILGQIGYRVDRPFLEETLHLLTAACADDRSEVVAAAIVALGHLDDDRALPAVLRHAGHSSDDVRHDVAFALPMVAGNPPAAEAVAALIQLSTDAVAEVRDWASFGLGSQLDADGERVRDALVARLTDEDVAAAGEALVGLARRGDARALPRILARLTDDPDNLVVEAAAELGAAAALPALLNLKYAGWQQDDPRPSVLDEAIRACSAGTATGPAAKDD